MSRTTTRLRTLLERKKLITIPSAYDALKTAPGGSVA